jgi:4-carboxymuconolactone decarboxylase
MNHRGMMKNQRWSLLVGLVLLLWVFPASAQSAPPSENPAIIQGCRSGTHIETAIPQDRLPEIPANQMTEGQKNATEEFVAGRGTPVFGPFVPLLRSPEVMLRAKAMGDYLRFKTVLPPKLREFVILLISRQWTQQYEWDVHCPVAIKAGLSPEVAKAVAEGRRPAEMSDDEEIIYEFCSELRRNQSVSDATYAKARANFGEQGVIDIVSLNGFYTFIAMVLNVARTPLPKGSEPALRFFPQ